MQSKPETIDTVLAKPAELSEDARERLEKFVEEEEGAFNRLGGWVGVAIAAFAIFVSLFHLYAAYEIVPAHVLRPTHVGMVLVLCFLLFPVAARFRDRIRWWDYLLAAVSAGTMLYVLSQGAYFGDRATAPTTTDWVVGAIFIVLLLEATRRSTGFIMPVVAICFALYAMFGKYLPPPWTHRGYPVEDLVAHLYMTLEGIFGTTVDVASSLIILFTVFGAVLQMSGAGRFFIDFSFAAMGGRRNAAGRAVVLSSFLHGRPIGLGRRHHRDHRHRRLSAAGEGRLRQERCRRAACGRRARRHHLAARARRRRLPDRRVPEDLVLRRDPHGDDPDGPLLLRHPGDGGDRRAQAGRRRASCWSPRARCGASPRATGSISAR